MTYMLCRPVDWTTDGARETKQTAQFVCVREEARKPREMCEE